MMMNYQSVAAPEQVHLANTNLWNVQYLQDEEALIHGDYISQNQMVAVYGCHDLIC